MSTNDPWARDFAEDAHEKARVKAAEYGKILDRMELNILPPPELPAWNDPNFQRMITARLHRLQGKKQDADKWEAVKELFREAGRANG